MENLSFEQLNALTTFVKQIRILLRLCIHSGVPIDADIFMEKHLTQGQLLAVCPLFQEPDYTTVNGYCGPVHFSGSVVEECSPFVRELARPWIRYHFGEASPSDVAFLTPEEEQNRVTAFQKLTEYVGVLENVLQSEEISGPNHGGHLPPDWAGPVSELIVCGQLAILQLAEANKFGKAREYLAQLCDERATALAPTLSRS